MCEAPIGIQLYSVRDGMEKDFEGTLKKVSELGYKSVEFAGFFGRTAEEVKALLHKYGLLVWGAHIPFSDLLEKYDETVEFHKAIGNKNLIIPVHNLWSQEKLDLFVSQVESITEKLSLDGMTLAFHNHDREFELLSDGAVPFEQLIYRTDIKFEIDVFWAFIGMKDPIALIERLGERVILIHIKDGNLDKTDKPLGLGEIPVAEIMAYAEKKSIPMIVESETCNPSGLAEAEICMNYIKSL